MTLELLKVLGFRVCADDTLPERPYALSSRHPKLEGVICALVRICEGSQKAGLSFQVTNELLQCHRVVDMTRCFLIKTPSTQVSFPSAASTTQPCWKLGWWYMPCVLEVKSFSAPRPSW